MSDIDKMSNAELDVAIAEELFGWTRKPYGNGNGDWIGRDKKVACSWCASPRFSTNAIAMLDVLAELHRRGWSINISSQSSATSVAICAEWRFGVAGECIGVSRAETMPLAVCGAALAAIRGSR